MSAAFPTVLSRWTLAGLVACTALVGDPASAAPARAKVTKKASKAKKGTKTKAAKKATPAKGPVKIQKKVIPLGKGLIKKATFKPGASLPSTGPGVVQPKEPGETTFVLSANTPNVPYGGRLIGHYPREWRPLGNSLGPGGEVWLSQNQVPGLSRAEAKLRVEVGFEYEVTLCTSSNNGAEMIEASVGNSTLTFAAGNNDCDAALVIKPQETGWASVHIRFAEEPTEHGPNAFAVHAVEVTRRPS